MVFANQYQRQRIGLCPSSKLSPNGAMVQLYEERVAPAARPILCQAAQERRMDGLQQDSSYAVPQAQRSLGFAHIVQQRCLRQNELIVALLLQSLPDTPAVRLLGGRHALK